MGIMSKKTDVKSEKVEKKSNNLKAVLKELYHVIEAIEFAETRKDEKLKNAYEAEAIQILRSIKETYKTEFLKLM